MENNFKNLAPKYFNDGFSCSESIAKAAVELGLADKSLVSIATSFSGGMQSRCLCGAVAGCEMVLGLLYGKYQDNTARAKGKEFYERFTKNHKVTCCRVLSGKFKDHNSPERKANCTLLVEECGEILDEMLKEYSTKEDTKTTISV